MTMITKNETGIIKDASGKKLIVTRRFNAPLGKVWQAWTQRELLDKWWAPKPWKTQTQSLDFTPGGQWRYAMVGPDGEKHYCLVNYSEIEDKKSFSGTDAFCDADGNILADFPSTLWYVHFIDAGADTDVRVELVFETEADLEKLVEMGFKEGFTMAHGNLDELLAE